MQTRQAAAALQCAEGCTIRLSAGAERSPLSGPSVYALASCTFSLAELFVSHCMQRPGLYAKPAFCVQLSCMQLL